MQFLDITGRELREGQRVAWARTTGGTLAQGTVISCEEVVYDTRRHGERFLVYVTLASNGRAVKLPYRREKFVVLAEAQPVVNPLADRVLAYMHRNNTEGRIFDISELRAALGLAFSDSFTLYGVLGTLVEDGEILQHAMPYMYLLPKQEYLCQEKR